jgi:hypothetical protein
VHRDGALIPGGSGEAAARARRAPLKALIVGTLLQLLCTGVVHLVPALLRGNTYPVLAGVAALATGFLLARAARGSRFSRQLRNGFLTGAGSSLAGAGLFCLLGHLPLELLPTAVGTGGVAGAVGVLPGAASVRPARASAFQ